MCKISHKWMINLVELHLVCNFKVNLCCTRDFVSVVKFELYKYAPAWQIVIFQQDCRKYNVMSFAIHCRHIQTLMQTFQFRSKTFALISLRRSSLFLIMCYENHEQEIYLSPLWRHLKHIYQTVSKLNRTL